MSNLIGQTLCWCDAPFEEGDKLILCMNGEYEHDECYHDAKYSETDFDRHVKDVVYL